MMDSFFPIVATPTTGLCRTAFAFSLAGMILHFCTHQYAKRQRIATQMIEGSSVSNNREDLVRSALNTEGMTHLLFVDEDMGFGDDVLYIMAQRERPIVSCNYRLRFPPAPFTATRTDLSRIETTAESHGLEEASYTGFGMCLIERRVLEGISEPRFRVNYNPETKHHGTEDSSFFGLAQSIGFIPLVDHDASRRVYHVGSLAYTWAEKYEDLHGPPA